MIAPTHYSAMVNERSAMLDCVRAVAILAVFAFHVATRYDPESLDVFAAFLQRVGFLGVDIFFPLSGYLISRYLLTSSRPDFVKVFFLRRAFRILPLYFLALFTYFLASRFVGVAEDVIDRLWINAFFLTGWFVFLEGKNTVPYLITWSLSVEEFGYILLGLFAWIMRRHMIWFLFFLCIFPAFLRYSILLDDQTRETFQALYYLPPARLDSIALGGVTAFFLHRKTGWLIVALLAAGLGIVVLMSIDILLYRTFLFLLVAIVTCVFIVFAETLLSGQRGVFVRFFASVGFYSYFSYLFQFFVIDLFLLIFRKAGMVPPSFWITFLITLVITHALAVVSYRVFEGPLIAFGRRLEP